MLGPAGRCFDTFLHTSVILNGSSLRWAEVATTQLHIADENSNNVSLYSRSLKNPALQLLQKSSKSASTTPQRPIWNTFGTVAVRGF